MKKILIALVTALAALALPVNAEIDKEKFQGMALQDLASIYEHCMGQAYNKEAVLSIQKAVANEGYLITYDMAQLVTYQACMYGSYENMYKTLAETIFSQGEKI